MKSQKGDIVQITDKEHHWYPCLIIVDEVKEWGIIGYIHYPTGLDQPVRPAYIRLTKDQYQLCGVAHILEE